MDPLNELKILWRTAKTDSLPDSSEIIRLAKQFRNQKLRNKIRLIIGAVFLIILLIIAILLLQPKLWTTKIGISLSILSGCIIALTNILSMNRFIQFKNYNTREFILFLEQTQKNQLYFHKNTQVLGLILSSLGLLLYQFEFFYTLPLGLWISYPLSLILICYFGFYLRPKKYKRESQKIHETLEKLRTINQQIE
jgi:hypothetical protein